MSLRWFKLMESSQNRLACSAVGFYLWKSSSFSCRPSLDPLGKTFSYLWLTAFPRAYARVLCPGTIHAVIAGFLCLGDHVCPPAARQWPKMNRWTCCPLLGALRWENRWPLWCRRDLVSVGFLMRILVSSGIMWNLKVGFFSWSFPWRHYPCLFESPSK